MTGTLEREADPKGHCNYRCSAVALELAAFCSWPVMIWRCCTAYCSQEYSSLAFAPLAVYGV